MCWIAASVLAPLTRWEVGPTDNSECGDSALISPPLHPLIHSHIQAMPHELQLPKLDISPFLDSARSDPALRQQVAADLDHHLTAYGVLYLTGLDAVVSQQDLDAVLDVSRAFFARPDAEKAKLRIQRGDGARGEPARVTGHARITTVVVMEGVLKLSPVCPQGGRRWAKT